MSENNGSIQSQINSKKLYVTSNYSNWKCLMEIYLKHEDLGELLNAMIIEEL